MNGVTIARPIPAAPYPWRLILTILLSLLFALLLGWSAKSIVSLQPVTLVPCKRCAAQCPCPRLSGTIRCGCPE
jgi:hypothetical protein